MDKVTQSIYFLGLIHCISLFFNDVLVSGIRELYVGVVIGYIAIRAFKTANILDSKGQESKAEIVGICGIIGVPLSLTFISIGARLII